MFSRYGLKYGQSAVRPAEFLAASLNHLVDVGVNRIGVVRTFHHFNCLLSPPMQSLPLPLTLYSLYPIIGPFSIKGDLGPGTDVGVAGPHDQRWQTGIEGGDAGESAWWQMCHAEQT
jgi:hypothetical protein